MDIGSGITEHDRSMLFQPFERAAGDAGSGRRGVGLGLFVGHRLPGLLGADIIVESEVGRGTTFAVCLPGSP